MVTVDITLNSCDETSAPQFAELDALAFPATEGSVERRTAQILTDPRCPVDRYFLARAGGKIVGGFRIAPLEMKVSEDRDGWIQIGGLGRIGVYPHYRRLGYAGGLMRLVVQRSFEQGDLLSLLYPSTFSIYRKFGYGLAARHCLYNVPPASFPDHPGRECFRPATADDFESINQIYENQLAGSLGSIRRNEKVWREHYLARNSDKRHAHWIYERDGVASGYIACHYQTTRNFYVHRMHVNEWFVANDDALRACLSFFRAQAANIDVVKLPTPVNFALETALVEPVWLEDPDLVPWHQPIGKLCSTLMGRIIRLREAIEARAWAADGSVNLIVDDWSLPDNSGYYALEVRGCLSKPDEVEPDIRLDISVLSSLYCGALTAIQARNYGLIEAPLQAARQLDRMLGDFSFMIWDYF